MTPASPSVSDEVLLPCPFCGGDAEVVQIGNEVTAKRGFEVRCLAWGCSTKKRAMVIRQPLEKAKEFAIAAWNTRPAALRSPVETEEAYEIGKRDGYESAVQDIDLMTGGDGEYRYCTNHDPERHCPDADTMKRKIAERFAAMSPVENVVAGLAAWPIGKSWTR